METFTVASAGQAATAVSCCLVGLVSCISNNIKKFRNAYFILIPSGKSSLVNSFGGTSKYNFIDLDSMAYQGEEASKDLIKSMMVSNFEGFKIKYFSKLKSEIKDLFVDLDGTFVFVSSNFELMSHVCSIGKGNRKLFVFLPDCKFRDAALLSSDGKGVDKSFVHNYNLILGKFGSSKEHLRSFSSWNDLQQQIAEILTVRPKL